MLSRGLQIPQEPRHTGVGHVLQPPLADVVLPEHLGRSLGLARETGSDYIVVGRPITQAEDPVAAYRLAVKEFLG